MSSQSLSSASKWPNSTIHPDFFWQESSLLNRTRLKRFVLLSLALHLLAILFQGLWPINPSIEKNPDPIKVRYIETEKPETAQPEGTIVDAPEPEKIETPRTTELLSSFDSRAHSNKKVADKKEYRRSKTVVPKARRAAKVGKQSTAIASMVPEKTADKLSQEEKKIPLPILPDGKEKPLAEKQPLGSAPSQSFGSGGALSLLDGFDAEKYASIDTQTRPMEDADDDEVVSLDTRETKYASYFARIKHQIERVWTYPSEAAQRGLNGSLTLRFRISKDGNLLGVRLIEGSRHEILDLAAIKAVKEAAPFYPFPATIKKEKLAILATFVYSPNYGLLRE